MTRSEAGPFEMLLGKACPSIAYRLHREILGDPISSPHMLALQVRILDDPAVQAVLSTQNADGWIGWTFHGYDSHEAGIRVLCEKGLEPSEPHLSAALDALDVHRERLDRGIGKAGRILDAAGFGGTETIRAALLAQAGRERGTNITGQVAAALEAFAAVLDARCVDDIVEPHRGRLVFRRGVAWPSIYHLRLLAFTTHWRNSENIAVLAQAVQRLAALSPLAAASVRHGSRLVAPASFAMLDFNPSLPDLDPFGWMMWLHRMELLGRAGVVSLVPELCRQVEQLQDMIECGGGLFPLPLVHASFARWGSYTGLMLERNWRAPERRRYDLTFRSLLILHYSGRLHPA